MNMFAHPLLCNMQLLVFSDDEDDVDDDDDEDSDDGDYDDDGDGCYEDKRSDRNKSNAQYGPISVSALLVFDVA